MSELPSFRNSTRPPYSTFVRVRRPSVSRGLKSSLWVSDGSSTPQSLRQPIRGKSHWWLVDDDDRVVDLTLAPRETSDFPYDRGKRRPFRYTRAGLSRRAKAIVERIDSSARER